MSVCANKRCPAKHYKNAECAPNCGQFKAHKHGRSEAAESARTRGSLTAPHGQSEIVTTAPQLAHSLPASRKKRSAGGMALSKAKSTFADDGVFIKHDANKS